MPVREVTGRRPATLEDMDEADVPEAGAETPTVVAPESEGGPLGEFVTEPAKLMRIAAMAKALLAEAQAAPSDEAGRELLRDIYRVTLDELCSVLSDDLREELSHMFLPLHEDGAPSTSELRIAQAQLVGWLEGLFNGIQAAVMSQQLAAQAQLHHIQRRRLETSPQGTTPGQYL